jgi:hypothetical protein
MVHDLYLVQVKSPEESKGPWDFVKLVATIPPTRRFGHSSAVGAVWSASNCYRLHQLRQQFKKRCTD